jgi:hypothetical protein
MEVARRRELKGSEMCRYTIMVAMSCLCILLPAPTLGRPASDAGAKRKSGVEIIALTEPDVTDKRLELRYEIKNGSDEAVWVCDSVDTYEGLRFEAYLTNDGQTLLIRRRHDVPISLFRDLPCGRYVCLGAGDSRTESLFLSVPVYLRGVFSSGALPQGTVYARRLVLEIGFYAEDLPRMVRGILEKAEKVSDENTDKNLALVNENIGGLLYFNESNEGLRHRDEQVLIPYTHQGLRGEQVLRVTVDGLLIPYMGIPWPEPTPPDLSRCTRVEIRYQPSMLEYFFPYAGERCFLSPAEAQYLQSLQTVIVNNPEHIKALAEDVSQGSDGGIATERSTARIVCYRDGERLTSFTVYDDASIETEEKQRFAYVAGLPNLRKLTPQIRPFEFRVQCAKNLRDLWHRLRLYHRAEKARRVRPSSNGEMVYPAPTKWCDAMVRAYRAIGMLDKYLMRPHMCPSAGHGKCHYAMNPKCKLDSPPDMVLLFETKGGWNQHGGPELFTFDNHEPRGGCVLLNDGTVKFIRTTDELQRLRWK